MEGYYHMSIGKFAYIIMSPRSRNSLRNVLYYMTLWGRIKSERPALIIHFVLYTSIKHPFELHLGVLG